MSEAQEQAVAHAPRPFDPPPNLAEVRPVRRSWPRGSSWDSVRSAAVDGGINYHTLRRTVLRDDFPNLLGYKIGKRLFVTNRPALWAWYKGFGLGPDAVAEWRAFEYEAGYERRATEPEPLPSEGAAQQYASSEQIAAEHKARVLREAEESYQERR